jgi:DNA end-binding protein Ku
MPPRAIWTGSIQFGLVNVPIRMYSAIDEHRLHFNLLHEPDDGRIGYQKICKKEDRPVPSDEIVKAFQIETGEYVTMTDEDFEAASARVENYRTVEVRDFVPYDEIDPIYFERTYYLGPQDGAERVYALLVKAMEDAQLAAITKFVLRDRQHLGCLRVRDGLLTLERMYFADEVRPVDELRPGAAEVSEQELELARRLIDGYSGPFRPEKYEDTYHDTLCEIVKAKARGEDVRRPEPEQPEGPPDLMEALRRSLETVRGGAGESGSGRAGRNGDGRLEDLTREELYELAKRADVAGRSRMDKDELIAALQGSGSAAGGTSARAASGT